MSKGFGNSKQLAKVIKGMNPIYHDKKLPKSTKKQVTKIAKKAAGNVVQLKWWDSSTGTQTAPSFTTNVWGRTSLIDIPQGDLDTNRNGDVVRLSPFMKVRLSLEWNINSLISTFVRFRLVIFQWRPTDSTPPTEANILNTSGSGNIDIFSMHRHDNRDQYHILYDKVHNLYSPTNTACYRNSYHTNFLISLKKARKMIQYTNATTTGSQKLYAMYVSDQVVNGPGIVMETRVNFRSA